MLPGIVKSERSLYFCLDRTPMPKVSEEHLAARRRQILDAALICFSRKGFHQTSMQAIFEEAGLSPGAVYRYFKSKEEIVQAIASETLTAFAAAIEPGANGQPLGPAEVIARLFGTLETVELREERLRLALQIWGEALHNPDVRGFLLDFVERVRAQITIDLREAQERGALDPELDAEYAGRVLLAMAQGFVVQSTWYPEIDRERFRDAAVGLLSQASAASRLRGERETETQ
jgi:AcrR family transcriptional regulator